MIVLNWDVGVDRYKLGSLARVGVCVRYSQVAVYVLVLYGYNVEVGWHQQLVVMSDDSGRFLLSRVVRVGDGRW